MPEALPQVGHEGRPPFYHHIFRPLSHLNAQVLSIPYHFTFEESLLAYP